MNSRLSRRSFFKHSGALAAVPAALSAGGLTACGGGDDTASLSSSEQQALTATDAVAAIRSGRVKAEELVATALARAAAVKDLNALIAIDESAALAAARSIDAARASGAALPPLAGLPIVVKDNINTRDFPTTGGTPSLRNVRPTANAPTVQKLIDAGAIVIGKANLHELAVGVTSTNFSSFAGFVHNPYDKARIPGGSSGGTAAAVAARIVTAGLGTDTAGSVRIPAALCGIASLRPSVGNGDVQRRYVDTDAVVPICHTKDTIGPMARTVADVALLDAVITGRGVPTAADPKGLRIGVPATLWAGLDNELAAVVTAARSKLAAAGVVFVDVDLVGLSALNALVSFPVMVHEVLADMPAYLAATGVTGLTFADMVAQLASPDARAQYGSVFSDPFAGAYPDAMNIHRPALQALYASYFSDNALDALMFPATILPAVPIDAVNGSSTVSINGDAPTAEGGAFIRNTDPTGSAGIPGVVLHAGMTTGKLPVGLELDGPLGSDQRLLAIGMAFEKLLGLAPAPSL